MSWWGSHTINIVKWQLQTTLWPDIMVTLSRQNCRVPSSVNVHGFCLHHGKVINFLLILTLFKFNLTLKIRLGLTYVLVGLNEKFKKYHWMFSYGIFPPFSVWMYSNAHLFLVQNLQIRSGIFRPKVYISRPVHCAVCIISFVRKTMEFRRPFPYFVNCHELVSVKFLSVQHR